MLTGTQNNSLSTSRTPLPFPILVSNWCKLSLADVYWFYPVLDWCKLVPRREVPEDDLTSLMSVNVEKAQHQNLTLATRLPYVESHPDAQKFLPRAQKISKFLPEPKNLKFPAQAQHIAGTTSSGRAGHLSTTRWQTHWARWASSSLSSSSNIIVFSCLICVVGSQLEILIWAFIKSH